MDKDEEPIYSSSDEESETESENENTEDENEENVDDDVVDDVVEEEDENDESNSDDDDDTLDSDDDDEQENEEKQYKSKKANKPEKSQQIGGAMDYEDDDDDDDNYQSPYLQKFNSEINKNYILEFHPECVIHNYDEITLLTQVVRDKANNIIDDLHRTIPFLTKYERTRIIGMRAKQINSGAKAFIKVPENVIDGYLVAEMELIQKRIPFIVRRPTPGGGSEYWNLKDLEVISG
jgi:DNA-directed RNA polymerase I, II, and III subunit RPABC2